MHRPVTTLFMLQSLDGKISTGIGNDFDFDKDIPKLYGVQNGLQTYYDLEMETDLWSMGSGAVAEKIGLNDTPEVDKTQVSFVIIDNNHLTLDGVRHYCNRSKRFILVTNNKNHPAYSVTESNMHILNYKEHINFESLLRHLYTIYSCKAITIQTGSTLNSLMLRQGVIDFVNIVIAPLLVGGTEVPSLIGGDSISELTQLGTLQLLETRIYNNSYVNLRYKVNRTSITKPNAYTNTSVFN